MEFFPDLFPEILSPFAEAFMISIWTPFLDYGLLEGKNIPSYRAQSRCSINAVGGLNAVDATC